MAGCFMMEFKVQNSIFKILLILSGFLYILSCKNTKNPSITFDSKNQETKQHDSFNQQKLYQKYTIDTILIQNENGETQTIICLDKSGAKRKEIEFCLNNVYTAIKYYDENENEVKYIRYGYDCDKTDTTKFNWKRTSVYKNNLLIKSVSIDQYGQEDDAVKNKFNKEHKLIEHQEFSYKSLSFTDFFTYENNMIIEKRIGGESHQNKLIGITEKKLDTAGREIESAYYTDQNNIKNLESIYYSTYDSFGNRSSYISYFFPGKKLYSKELYFYSTPSKLDSCIRYFSEDGVVKIRDKEIRYYDDRNLLVRRMYEDYKNKYKSIYNYKYK